MPKLPLRSRLERLPAWLLPALLVAALAALAYLPLAGKLGLYFDDWYLIYAGHTQGPEKFWDIFIIDRPLRAVLVGAFYRLFGDQAALYTLSGYAWRVGAALGLRWLLLLLAPERRGEATLGAALFAVYPGFLSQVNAIDYQSHLAALCFAAWSIALSVAAALQPRRARAAGLALLAFVFALIYLGLMEYYIGMEGLRFGALALLAYRRQSEWRPRLRALLRVALPAVPGPALFLFWRMVLFQNQRGATDIAAMAAGFGESPLLRGLWALVYLFQDLWNTLVFAWAVPVYQTAFRLRLREFLLALTLAILAAALAELAALARRSAPRQDQGSSSHWQRETLLLGLFALTVALAPVAFGDRHVTFPDYSRFTLPAAAGAVMVITALLAGLSSRRMRASAYAALVLLAVLTHNANAFRHADETADIQAFWWQVAWRAPGLQPGTTLLANYPSSAIPEDYYVWGPANLIYFPEKKDANPTPLSLSAAVLNTHTVEKILAGGDPETVDRRGLLSTRDFGNVLILTMPQAGSCAQILDGANVEISSREAYDIQLVASHSQIERVLTEGEAPTPPAAIFGPEPAHTWCYYYEKGALARQQGDWEAVARLGDEAIAGQIHPLDRVEWLPFLQAYARLGRDEQVRALTPVLQEEDMLRRQVCAGVSQPSEYYRDIAPELRAEMKAAFCD